MGVVPINFRDVGLTLNQKFGFSKLPAGRLLRCGQITNETLTWKDLGEPLTILNLLNGVDANLEKLQEQAMEAGKIIQYIHLPAENDNENYDTANKDVYKWVTQVVCAI